MRAVDPNMDTALQWAEELGPPPQLPLSLQDVNKRAKLVNTIDGRLILGALLTMLSDKEKARRLNDVAGLSETYISDVNDHNVRTNISLRLWSGCISAAKTIALQTRSGPNTRMTRELTFRIKIDRIAQRDPIYHAGVEAAPSFKRLRKEDYSFEGVPENSAVRKYP